MFCAIADHGAPIGKPCPYHTQMTSMLSSRRCDYTQQPLGTRLPGHPVGKGPFWRASKENPRCIQAKSQPRPRLLGYPSCLPQ
jgi:hypothetical protein